jgi:pseudaminic acid biosynthesis-associated methylase
MANGNDQSEPSRLEHLWAGQFGDAYIERNLKAANGRAPFWNRLLTQYQVATVLEVGCNVGANLTWIAQSLPARSVFGVDVNERALQLLRSNVPGVNALWSLGRSLPFRDHYFDMVFTAGVLIHQPELSLPLVMAEIVRCSRKYVLCMEYFAENTTEVFYRGETGALFKRNYGRLYQELFPNLAFLENGELTPDQGWDNVTYWLFEKTRA